MTVSEAEYMMKHTRIYNSVCVCLHRLMWGWHIFWSVCLPHHKRVWLFVRHISNESIFSDIVSKRKLLIKPCYRSNIFSRTVFKVWIVYIRCTPSPQNFTDVTDTKRRIKYITLFLIKSHSYTVKYGVLVQCKTVNFFYYSYMYSTMNNLYYMLL